MKTSKKSEISKLLAFYLWLWPGWLIHHLWQCWRVTL